MVLDKYADDSVYFDEFKARSYADWKRVRLAIEHENNLINHRITWLLSTQGFLFAAAVAILGSAIENKAAFLTYSIPLLLIIAAIGELIAFSIGRVLKDAHEYIRELDQWWYMSFYRGRPWESNSERSAAIYSSRKFHPPLQGFQPGPSDKVGSQPSKRNSRRRLAFGFRYLLLPWVFQVGWILLISVFLIQWYSLKCNGLVGNSRSILCPEFNEVLGFWVMLLLIVLLVIRLHHDGRNDHAGAVR